MDSVVCFNCGKSALEIAQGPRGFVQSCRFCGSSVDLDDVLEPLDGDGQDDQRLKQAA